MKLVEGKQDVAIDPRLEAIVERMLERCACGGEGHAGGRACARPLHAAAADSNAGTRRCLHCASARVRCVLRRAVRTPVHCTRAQVLRARPV